MAKRFTDTNIWAKAWFRKLTPKMKEAWRYICENCDHAGLWEIDTETMSFFIGEHVTLDEMSSSFGDKLFKVNSNKLFIKSFFEFQYGTSNSSFRAKESALAILSKYGLVADSGDLCVDGFEPLLKSSVIVNKPLDKGESTSTSNTKKYDARNFDFDLFYRDYPRKVGKSRAKRIFDREIRSAEDLSALIAARDRYVAYCKSTDTFFKHADSFMNQWRDWTDPNSGGASKPVEDHQSAVTGYAVV